MNIDQLMRDTVIAFGKQSANAVTIEENNAFNNADPEAWKQPVADMLHFMESIEHSIFNERDEFIKLCQTLREVDSYATMYIVCVASKFRDIPIVSEILPRWLEIAHEVALERK